MQVLQENSKPNSRLGYVDNQPSHYEYDAFNPEQSKEKLEAEKSAGEFEMPVIDTHDLHKADAKKSETTKDTYKENTDQVSKYMEYAVHAANGFNIISSGVTALGRGVSKNERLGEFLNKFAAFGAKLSMGVNSAFNIFNGHKKKDLANVIGYAGELAVAVLAPYNILGLLRGVTFSTYQTSNIMSAVAPMKESKSYSEYIQQFKERMPKVYKKLFDPKTYMNFKDNLGIITGGWGSLFSYAGVLGWAATGSSKLGGWVKGVGELLVDSYQVLTKEHWDAGRQFYIGSGMAFIMGSLCEIISKQRNNDPVTMALYFFGSGIGRMMYTVSNILGENEYQPGNADTNKNISLSKILNLSPS